MKKRFIVLVAIVVCFVSYGLYAIQETENKKVSQEESKEKAKDPIEEMKEQLEATVEKLAKEFNVPGVNVGIWVPGEIEWQTSWGVADLETKQKLTFQDYFRIGSLTKTFIGTAILQLVDEGKLSLDDKIAKYIKDVPNGKKITLRQLGNMTNGLANYTANDEWVLNKVFKEKERNWNPEELLEVAFKMPVLFEPGKGWAYCNTNVVLLGLVIEEVTGLSLEQYLNKNIFCPLNLKHTFFPCSGRMPQPYAHGYTKQTVDNNEEDASLRNPSYTYAAGQIISRFDDLKIWAKALGTGELLSPEAFKERLVSADVSPNTPNKRYAFLVGINNGWLMHTGTLPGYNVTIAYLPQKETLVVCMVNTDIPLKVDGKEISAAPTIVEALTKIVTPKNVISP